MLLPSLSRPLGRGTFFVSDTRNNLRSVRGPHGGARQASGRESLGACTR